MFNDFIKEATLLENLMDPYAIAMVVRRVVPTSGKPGDKCIIRRDGSISGWIGGGCTKGIILKEAMAAMKDGKPRLVSIDNNADAQKEGIVSYTMSCHSGGAVDVYIEPVLPKPHLMIMGRSHIAMALSKLGKTMGYNISIVAENIEHEDFTTADQYLQLSDFNSDQVRSNTCIVVSTQGEGDEVALEHAIKSGASYVAFVASMRKANAIFRTLKDRGVSFDDLKKIKTPAGLNINAKLPEEVAISILAQIIEHIRKPVEVDNNAPAKVSDAPAMPEDFYINPVCQVPVHKATAKHVLEHEGEKVYFCCDGCKVSFEKEPSKDIVANA